MNRWHSGEVAEDVELERETALELRRPRRYQVILHNDDYTPMEFVVRLLQDIFHHPANIATGIMFEVHTRGRGICGVYTRDIAETRVVQVNTCARANEHPLLCSMEPE